MPYVTSTDNFVTFGNTGSSDTPGVIDLVENETEQLKCLFTITCCLLRAPQITINEHF